MSSVAQRHASLRNVSYVCLCSTGVLLYYELLIDFCALGCNLSPTKIDHCPILCILFIIALIHRDRMHQWQFIGIMMNLSHSVKVSWQEDQLPRPPCVFWMKLLSFKLTIKLKTRKMVNMASRVSGVARKLTGIITACWCCCWRVVRCRGERVVATGVLLLC